jgi:hypothetical protein
MIKWPKNKQFAFTIVDDTDEATVRNIKPVYDYLYKTNIITTKTVWVLRSRDAFGGEALSDNDYKAFIQDIANKGFEVAFHGAGSGDFNRGEVLCALDTIKDTVGYYPRLHVNHALNKDNLYFGSKRFVFPLNKLYRWIKKMIKEQCVHSLGDEKESNCFWGDFAKRNIKYIRNRVFSKLNTLAYDKFMPYKEEAKKEYSNYWFSSSDGCDCKTFIKLLTKKNIDKLEKQKGCAIVYTHFAYGFVNENGELDEEFKKCVTYLASKNGWFVPTSELLDYINSGRENEVYITNIQSLYLDIRWFTDRIIRKLFFGV